MFIFKYIVVSFLVSWLFYKVLKKDYNLFAVTIFLVPYTAIYMNIGLNLSAYQISQAILILFTGIAIVLNRNRNIINFKNKNIYVFMVYSIVITLIMPVFFTDHFVQAGSWFRTEGRFVGQLVLLLLSFSILPIAFNYIKNSEDIYKYIRVFLDGMVILAALGWLQFVVYTTTGIDMFPLGLRDGVAYSGIEQTLGLFRMSSLSHEPKGLAVFMTTAFFVLHILNVNQLKMYKYDFLIKSLFVVTMFFTLATSGIVLFFIMLFVFYLYRIKIIFKQISINKIFYTSMIVGGLGLFILIYQATINDIIQTKVLDRDLVSEDFDAPIQILFFKSPEYLLFGSGIGNVHNLAYPYIPAEYLHYMGDNIFVAKSGYLKTLSELGLIGFLLFVFIFYSIYKRLGKIKKYQSFDNKKIYSALQFCLLMMLVAYFARTYAYGVVMLFLAFGNVITYAKINNKIFNKAGNK